MKCLNCGNEIKQGASFCTVCGQKITEENYQQKEEMTEQNVQEQSVNTDNQTPELNRCPVCSNVLKENAVFCNNCGAAINNLQKADNEQAVDVQAHKNVQTKSTNKNIIILVIVLAVILIASAVTAFYFINKNNDDKKENYKVNTKLDDKEKQKDDEVLDVDDIYDEMEDEDGNDVDIEDVKVFVSDIDTTLYVRKYPRHDSKVIDEIDDNTMMFFFGEKEKGRDEEGDYRNWYEVKTEDGKVGWVLADEVRVRDPYEIKEEIKEVEIKEVYIPKTSHYQVYKSDVTWEQANIYARQMGGHLVCINSEEEYNKVCSMAESEGLNVFWTGMKRTTYDWNSSYWQDGTMMTYSNWMSGEPTYSDKDGTPENYLIVFKVNNSKAKGWVFNDVPNDITRYYKGKIGYIVEFEE